MRRPLALAVSLALATSIFSGGCSISEQVRGAIADSNAAALDGEYFRRQVAEANAPRLDDVDKALSGMEREIENPEVSAGTKAALRVRQAMLCIANQRFELAGTYFERVEAGALSARDAKLFKAREYLVWWFGMGATPAIGNQDQSQATRHIDLLVSLAHGTDDVDFYLAYSATNLATALVKSAKTPDILTTARRAVAHHLSRFANRRAVVDFVLTKQLTGDSLKARLPPRDVVHMVEASNVLHRMKRALEEQGARLDTPSAPPDDELDRLLAYLNRP